MTDFELLSLTISGLGAFFVGTTVLLLIKQLKLIVSAHADNHDWNRRIETQHALDKRREIGTEKLNEKFNYMNSKTPIKLDLILASFEEDHSLQIVLNRLLNYYERLANGVFLGTYDEITIKAIVKGPMEREVVRFRNYIEYTRDQGSKSTWTAHQRLVEKWDSEQLKSEDRTPIGKI